MRQASRFRLLHMRQIRLQPRGVAVLIEAKHMCMTTRGVHQPGVDTVTTCMRGEFRTDTELKREFMAMAARGAI
jgi:GTP cyclohydrolase IA